MKALDGRALFLDLSVIKIDEMVGASDSRQPVRDNDNRRLWCECLNGVEHLLLKSAVDVGGRLVRTKRLRR